LWSYKKLADGAKQAELGHTTWDEALSQEDLPEEVAVIQDLMRSLKLRMEEAVLSQRRFLADASHEIRSPLTIMKGDIEIALRRERDVADYKRVLKSNLEEIDRLEYLVRDLMFLARADASELIVNRTPMILDEVIQAVIERLGGLSAEKGIELGFENLTGSPAVIEADPERLKQLFINLINNAIRYTPKGGSIKVSISNLAGVYKVEVIDTGIGIPAEDLPRLFDRFYRVDKARSRALGGSGLGLCISKWIIESNGGDISIKSAVNVGTTVTARFLAATTF
jgi:signal transduction histidine kinase